MPKGIPKNGVNKGWFKTGSSVNTGRKRPDMIGNTYGKGLIPWNKGKPSENILEASPQWKNGKAKMANGYTRHRLYNKYILEHRFFIEQQLGRKLEEGEIIHHINGDRSDNSLANLMLFPSHSLHMKYHWKMGFKRKRRNK